MQGIVHLVSPTVAELTDRLLESYERVGGINHVDGVNLPSKTRIGQICCELLRLLFPGFFGETVIHASDLRQQTETLMRDVERRLEDEIHKSLKYQLSCQPGQSGWDPAVRARELTCNFLNGLPDLREILKTDVEAAYQGDPAAISTDEVIVAYPYLEAIAIQRMAHILYQEEVVLIPRIMTEWAHSRTGMDLHPGARIGTHFFIDHGTGTVVGETCQIGNHVKIYHGVTLGAKSTSKVAQLRGSKRHPTIEDHVTIYPGATILGGDTVIGTRSTIGGNVFLIDSVEPDSLVVYDGLDMRVLDKNAKRQEPKIQI